MESGVPGNRRPDDEAAGTRPAVLFAIGLGALVGGTAIAIFIGGSALISAFGGIGTGASGLLAAAGLWLAFWIGLSLGLAGGLAVGYRMWARVTRGTDGAGGAALDGAPRDLDAEIREEQAAAVREAEEFLHRTNRPRDR
jgi:hypothetical protein